LKAQDIQFFKLLQGSKQFIIPIYQRTYSWGVKQCRQLLSDIEKIGKSEDFSGHFLGSIVYIQEHHQTTSDVPKLLVIDGQQRLTTISILLTALANAIENSDAELSVSAKKIRNLYLFNSEEEDEKYFKLILTQNDKDTLLQLQKSKDFLAKESVRIAENYDYFLKALAKMDLETIYRGLQKLFVVEVSLERGKDNPQLIFESMNSTGLDLTQADLIRNYILMGLEPKIQKELYENYWYPMEQSFGNEYATKFDAFVRDYLTIKNKGDIPNKNAVYEAFKEYFTQESLAGLDVETIVKGLYEYSKHYVNMALLKEDDAKLLQAFKNIYTLKVNVAYPFLLEIYVAYVTEEITKEEFLKILSYVENYVFRRVICGIPTNSLNKTFANFMKRVDTDNFIDSIGAYFVLLKSYQRFPSDAEFAQSFVDRDIYNLRNRNYLLSKIENDGRKEFVDIGNYTIEHIMPQNKNLSDEWQEELGENWTEIQQRYLHTIGNLTLTGYNSELSDKPFSEKKNMEGGFTNSPIFLNRSVASVQKWTKDVIEHRAKALAKKAKEIWSFPNISDELLEKYIPKKDSTDTEYTISHYEYMKDDTLELYKTLEQQVLNLDASVKREFKKLYIAFKSTTNFVDIVPQASGLRLSLNINFDEIDDTKNSCRDVSNLGRWGNGEVEYKLEDYSQIEYALFLIEQALDKQIGRE